MMFAQQSNHRGHNSDPTLKETVQSWSTIVSPADLLDARPDAPTKRAIVLETLDGRTLSLSPCQKKTIGRSDAADFVVSDGHLSRCHFSVDCGDRGNVIRDLKSTNGTYVNGTAIRKTVLEDGDQIVAGKTVFVVRLPHQ